ncbi:MAG: hypothetical protein LBB55_03185 [Zoogloeaceae bacterium]|jgi:hypothetical protein|nr:hypothetical protein [Zoogloeaceae bacterium]
MTKNNSGASDEDSFLSAPLVYDPLLIPQLMEERQRLNGILERVRHDFAAHDFVATMKGLRDFKRGIATHLHEALYDYLEMSMAYDMQDLEHMRDLRDEMSGIGQSLEDFLEKYSVLSSRPELVTTFKKDLEAIGALLARRSEREETSLYALYTNQLAVTTSLGVNLEGLLNGEDT